MSDFFAAIGDFFRSFGATIQHMISAPLKLIGLITSSVSYIGIFLSYVPTEIYIFFSAVMVISVFYFILNR